MKIFFVIIGSGPFYDNFRFSDALSLLSNHGHEVSEIKYFSDAEDFKNEIDSFESDSVIITAGKSTLIKNILNNCGIKEEGYYSYNTNTFFPLGKFSKRYFVETVIPFLDTANASAFNTTIIKTFNITGDDLFEKVDEEFINAPDGISFNVSEPTPLDCTLSIKYLQSDVNISKFNEIVFRVIEKLDKYIYAKKNVSISEMAAEILLRSKRKLSIAESFTGGGIASSLVQFEGMSECLLESLVTYAVSSKTFRLGVSHETINTMGAVSAEVAYEMAMELFSNPFSDIVLSTTGNAGPAIQNGHVGLCYIAIGNRKSIHIYKADFANYLEEIDEENRRFEITQFGIKYALFGLIKFLSK